MTLVLQAGSEQSLQMEEAIPDLGRLAGAGRF